MTEQCHNSWSSVISQCNYFLLHFLALAEYARRAKVMVFDSWLLNFNSWLLSLVTSVSTHDQWRNLRPCRPHITGCAISGGRRMAWIYVRKSEWMMVDLATADWEGCQICTSRVAREPNVTPLPVTLVNITSRFSFFTDLCSQNVQPSSIYDLLYQARGNFCTGTIRISA